MKKGQETAVTEMDCEISVDVEVKERRSTSLNMYGSPVVSRGRRNEEPVEATSQAWPLHERESSGKLRPSFPREFTTEIFFVLIAVYSSK